MPNKCLKVKPIAFYYTSHIITLLLHSNVYMALLFHQFSPRLLKELILVDIRNVEKTQALVFFNPYNFF